MSVTTQMQVKGINCRHLIPMFFQENCLFYVLSIISIECSQCDWECSCKKFDNPHMFTTVVNNQGYKDYKLLLMISFLLQRSQMLIAKNRCSCNLILTDCC